MKSIQNGYSSRSILSMRHRLTSRHTSNDASLSWSRSLRVGIQAHGGVQSYLINGVDYYKGFSAYIPPEEQITIARPWYSIDPLTGVDTPVGFMNSQPVTTYGEAVPGGGQISAHVHMARCPGQCAEANSTQLLWFKISHEGLISGNLVSVEYGGVEKVVATGVYDAAIPSALADGEYLIRHELIALHPEWTGPQFYPECAQLIVSGGGGKLPPAKYLVTFPGGYKTEDPGLNVDLYDPRAVNITHYEIPGPLIWDGQQDYSGAL
ncbi:cellulose-growth-specific protein [Coprinopsis sp. MPI-PUGE-AT-0042]|nr:cellulose-growth-specific protein [Coprinopsis sp. MPI-PUGE-AT-0042]